MLYCVCGFTCILILFDNVVVLHMIPLYKCTLLLCPFVAMPIYLLRHDNIKINSHNRSTYTNAYTHMHTRTHTHKYTYKTIYKPKFRQKFKAKMEYYMQHTSVYIRMMNYWIADDQSSSRNRQQHKLFSCCCCTASFYPLCNS